MSTAAEEGSGIVAALVAAARGPGSQAALDAAKQRCAGAADPDAVCGELQALLSTPQAKVRGIVDGCGCTMHTDMRTHLAATMHVAAAADRAMHLHA